MNKSMYHSYIYIYITIIILFLWHPCFLPIFHSVQIVHFVHAFFTSSIIQ